MRLRSLLTLLLIVTVVYCSLAAEALVKEYRQMQWEDSPLYAFKLQLQHRKNLRSAAHNKYDHFKLDCLAFGSDMKLLKALEAAEHTPEYQEKLKTNLYLRQYMLIERWFLFDALLFSGVSDHTTYMYYLKHLKPRSI